MNDLYQRSPGRGVFEGFRLKRRVLLVLFSSVFHTDRVDTWLGFKGLKLRVDLLFRARF
jgi:hypothetical protein